MAGLSLPNFAGPAVLLILDGWGLGSSLKDNAIAQGETPNLDRFYREYPWCNLRTCGVDVGLTVGQMGDSNVGHLNIGAGRVVFQWLGFLDKAIADGDFARNTAIRESIARARGATWHLMGLLSDGGVHSHIEHLLALLRMARDAGQTDVSVHVFLDGRDVPPRSATAYLERLEQEMSSLGVGRIASLGGRYYAMDRDKRWDRVERAWRALRHGEGLQAASAAEALQQAYERGETDEFVQPTLITPEGQAPCIIADGDSIFCFNYRADRTRQLAHLFTDDVCDVLNRGTKPNIAFATMSEYEQGLAAEVAFYQPPLSETLGEVLAAQGLRQLRLAETEKYAHVTFFFDGGVEQDFSGCERVLIPSPQVATYDLQPEMSASQITETLIEALEAHRFDVIIANFANGDMVGHTGNWQAALSAVSYVDHCLGRVAEAVLAQNGVLLVTADHGNVDQMRQEDGTPHTAHTLSDAPFLLISRDKALRLRNTGRLADVAPTLLQLMCIPQPLAMTGISLLQ